MGLVTEKKPERVSMNVTGITLLDLGGGYMSVFTL